MEMQAQTFNIQNDDPSIQAMEAFPFILSVFFCLYSVFIQILW